MLSHRRQTPAILRDYVSNSCTRAARVRDILNVLFSSFFTCLYSQQGWQKQHVVSHFSQYCMYGCSLQYTTDSPWSEQVYEGFELQFFLHFNMLCTHRKGDRRGRVPDSNRPHFSR